MALFKVIIPLWVKWVGLAFHFDVSHNRGTSGGIEGVVLPVDFAMKNPILATDGLEILVFDPAMGFFRMTPFSPLPKELEDDMIYRVENHLADHMAVVVCPAPDNGVKQHD